MKNFLLFFAIAGVLSLSQGQSKAQQLMNLPAPTGERFTLTEKTWPANHGQADVCLWNDDKLAAATINIDDNIEADHAWWLSMQSQYNINFTWFIIIGNVTSWDKYQTLVDQGNEVQAHDLAIDYVHGAINDSTDTKYIAAITQVRDTVNKMLTNNKCLTFAYPYGVNKSNIIKDKYIAMRGVNGIMNKANTINYLELNSRSASNDLHDIRVLLDSSETLFNESYYRGLLSYHYHSVGDKAATETFLSGLSAKSDSIWIGKFSEIARYAQSRDSHTLNVTSVTNDEVKFTLTDQMNDTYFDFPLTVKIRVNNTWTGVSAVQNGTAVPAELITNNGNTYALVKAVPDAGEATVTGTITSNGNNAPVLAPIGNQNTDEGTTLNVNISATDADAADVLTISATNLPSFASFTDNGDKTAVLSINPDYGDAGVYNNISISVSDGTDSHSEGIIITVNESSVQVVKVTASSDDGFVSDPAIITTNNPYTNNIPTYGIKVGRSAVDGSSEFTSGIFPFQLPAIPAGKDLTNASLKVYVNYGRSWATTNIDLYGLTYRSVSDITTADYYSGAFGAGNGSDVGIEDDYFTKNAANGTDDTPRWEETSVASNTKLKDYILAQYAAGAVAGDWIFLRLSVDNTGMPGAHYFGIDGVGMSNPAELSFMFEDNGSNQAPVLAPIGNQTVAEGQTSNVNVSATDADGNDTDLRFSISGNPTWATLTDNLDGTATLALTPQPGDAGTYPDVIITVTDGTDDDTETINITVNSPTTDILASNEDGFVSDPIIITANNPYTVGSIKIGSSAVDGSSNLTSGVIPFQLPEIPAGKNLTGANFKVYVTYGRQWANTNIDLYGLTYRSAASITTADYYSGDFGAGNGSDVGIADDYFTKNVAQGSLDTPRWEETDTTADLNLTNYIKAQYAAGAVAGDYIFLRLSVDNTAMTGSQYFTVDGGDMTNPAMLSITFGDNGSANTPPVLASIGNQTAKEGVAKSVAISATDADGNALTFSISGNPAGVTLTDNTDGTASIEISDAVAAGTHSNIVITVSDGTDTDTETISITVEAANTAPVLASIGNQTVTEGTTKDVDISATDTDGNDADLRFSISGNPTWANLTDNLDGTATLALAPLSGDAGTYPDVIITVTDGTNDDTETISITVDAASSGVVINSAAADGMVNDATVSTVNNPYIADVSYDTGSGMKLGSSDNGGGVTLISDILVFELPERLAGQVVEEGDITIDMNWKRQWVSGSIDLYGLPFSTDNTIAADMHYSGAFLTDQSGNTGLQDGFWTAPAGGAIETPGSISSSTDASSKIAAYINAQYDNGAVAGNFVFIRLSPAEDYSANGNFVFVSSGDSGDDAIKPKLTLTFSAPSVNTAPVLSSIGNQTAEEGVAKSFAISATDADGDALTFSISGNPTGVTLTDNTDGTASIEISDAVAAGTHSNIIITVSDGTDTDTETISITVEAANTAPVLASIGNQTAEEGVAKSVAVSATDADGDALTFSISGNPTGVTLTDNTDGTASIEISAAVAAGTHSNIIITVSDGTDTDTETISITIEAANTAPVLASIGNQTAEEGVAKSVAVSATDADDDALTFSISGNPTGVTLTDNTDGTASIEISAAVAAGTHSNIGITVSDGTDTDTETISITVEATATGIADISTTKVNVYPNPAKSGQFTINLNEFDGKTDIYIQNIQGKVVFKEQASAKSIMPNVYLESGSYIITIKNNKNTVHKKLIIE